MTAVGNGKAIRILMQAAVAIMSIKQGSFFQVICFKVMSRCK